MRIIRPLLYLLLILVGAFLLFLSYASLDNFRPGDVIVQKLEKQPDILQDSSTLNLLIWNIGYAGLDASMDFFYDGGKQMRPEQEGVHRNMDGISLTLQAYLDYDFVLLQEVDLNSKRSYHLDEYALIQDQFKDHYSFFGKNYDVFFVPIPLKEPMGRVESGLMTVSGPYPVSVERHAFPGNYSWPMALFMLDRCFLVNRYILASQKELVVINTHNSAYDDGTLRAAQMDYLSDYLLSEYAKGNYVIVGGDWNQTPYGIDPKLPYHLFDTENLTYVDKDYPAPDWIWAYDPGLPTNRRVKTPYDPASTLTTIIDCFLLSPNLQVTDVATLDLGFTYSDHQAVQLKVKLSQLP
jgi:endonuclease/exonuclease/phosphatase family metal-dependent hydrolase